MLSLLQALEDLVEASESMAATYECIRGRTPEDDDTHTHELWAEEFLAERTNAANETIASARMAIAAPEMLDALIELLNEVDVIAEDYALWCETNGYTLFGLHNVKTKARNVISKATQK